MRERIPQCPFPATVAAGTLRLCSEEARVVVTADVAVVGLGAMGAAALYQLSRRGVRAVGIDRFAPPHSLGSSHGETRITRQAVGEGAAYAPLVLRSHAIWRELQGATGSRLLVDCGFVLIGATQRASSHHGKPDFLRATTAVARQFAIAHEVLDRADLARRFPQFTDLAPDDMGYYEPGAGFLHPEACIAAQLAEAQRLGARTLLDTRVGAIAQRNETVRIETTTGPVEAASVIVTAGAWTAKLLGPPFDRLLRVTRQALHWFAPDDPAAFHPARCPVFFRMHGPGDSDYFYGFPTPQGGAGVKLATEQYDSATDAETADRSLPPGEATTMYATQIAGRLAGVTPHVLRSEACLYTNTPDSGFLIDAHPAMPRVLVVSACSGHGFKHSAAIGEAAAEHVTAGHSRLDLSAFRLDRFTVPMNFTDPPAHRER
jgi:sarcosine oxidase